MRTVSDVTFEQSKDISRITAFLASLKHKALNKIPSNDHDTWFTATRGGHLVGVLRVSIKGGYQLLQDLEVSPGVTASDVAHTLLMNAISNSHQQHKIWSLTKLDMLGSGVYERLGFQLMLYEHTWPQSFMSLQPHLDDHNLCIMMRQPYRI